MLGSTLQNNSNECYKLVSDTVCVFVIAQPRKLEREKRREEREYRQTGHANYNTHDHMCWNIIMPKHVLLLDILMQPRNPSFLPSFQYFPVFTSLIKAAILSDTADWLEKTDRTGTRSNKTIHVVVSIRSGLPSNIEKMLSTWLPSMVTIEAQSALNNTQERARTTAATAIDESETIEKRWTVKTETGRLRLSLVRTHNIHGNISARLGSYHLAYEEEEEDESSHK